MTTNRHKLSVTAALGIAIAGFYSWRRRHRRRLVVITGGCGNLGIKLANHLLSLNNENKSRDNGIRYSVILLEHPEYYVKNRVPDDTHCRVVLGDLCDGSGDWTHQALRGADTVVHFSSVNPYPNATWEESAHSMLHNFHVCLEAAVRHKVRRVILASSNHVMGGYKDDSTVLVTPLSPPRCGTLVHNIEQRKKTGDAVAYAAAKLAGEQLCRALAATTSSRTSFCVLRIGWCQPGENLPETLSAAGLPPEFESKVVNDDNDDNNNNNNNNTDENDDVKQIKESPKVALNIPNGEQVDEEWFKNMWLSNGDFLKLFTAAIDVETIPGRFMLVNAMSNNKGSQWSLKETEVMLGVMPRDDSSNYTPG